MNDRHDREAVAPVHRGESETTAVSILGDHRVSPAIIVWITYIPCPIGATAHWIYCVHLRPAVGYADVVVALWDVVRKPAFERAIAASIAITVAPMPIDVATIWKVHGIKVSFCIPRVAHVLAKRDLIDPTQTRVAQLVVRVSHDIKLLCLISYAMLFERVHVMKA